MNRLFVVPITSLFLLIIPILGIFITIIIICVWYLRNQDKIHDYFSGGGVEDIIEYKQNEISNDNVEKYT